VTISAQDGDGDNVIIHAEAQGGVTLSGSVTGLAAGTTFNITVADGSFTHSYTATVNAQGTGWTATIPPTDATTLKDGTLTVTAQVTDQFGNQSEQATQGFAVDETLPTVTINGISPDTGSSASDGITNVAVVTVSGTTKANSTVKLFDDGNQAGTVIADSTGHWSVTNVALSEGVNDLTATATDAAGNVSTVSASFVATLDQDTGEHLPVNFNGLTGGYAVEDQTITAVVIDTDNDVPTSGITYTWQISHDGGNTWSTVGANTPTYTPGEDDEGGLLKVLASFTDAAGNTESGSSTVGVLPLLTIANNSLLVSTNGSVSLGISLTQEPIPDDTISVTISFPSSGAHDPTVAAGDHATGNPHTSGGITTYTFSVADVNSGLTFTHHGDPVDTLTVQEILNGDIIATSQTMMVTDPPVSGGGVTVSEQPASATGEHTPVQSTSANNHVIVGSPLTEMLSGNGDSSTFLFKTNLDHITDPKINFAQNNANTLLHLPARLDDTGVHTVTDGAHRSHPHFDVTQLASFKVADDGSTHPIQQSTPADDDRHAPEINSASNAKNHLLQLDDDGTMTGGAHPAHPHSDVTQLANFKFADNGSAHPGTVVPHDSPILTALLSDSNGTHEPAAPDLAKTFSVPGTVMSDGASDKFIFAENVGHDMVGGHKPDMTELDHTAPAHIQHLLDAAHDTNAVSTLDPNHATAPQDMTTVQLPHHHGDFHFA
jgi:hypothetical protein